MGIDNQFKIKYGINLAAFSNIPVMDIIELYKKIEEKYQIKENYQNWEKLNIYEKDFFYYFTPLRDEYEYMTNKLHRKWKAIEGRLNYVLEKIINGERFTPIYLMEKPEDSKKRIVKLDCLIDKFLEKWQEKWQAGKQMQIPETDYMEPEFDDW